MARALVHVELRSSSKVTESLKLEPPETVWTCPETVPGLMMGSARSTMSCSVKRRKNVQFGNEGRRRGKWAMRTGLSSGILKNACDPGAAQRSDNAKAAALKASIVGED